MSDESTSNEVKALIAQYEQIVDFLGIKATNKKLAFDAAAKLALEEDHAPLGTKLTNEIVLKAVLDRSEPKTFLRHFVIESIARDKDGLAADAHAYGATRGRIMEELESRDFDPLDQDAVQEVANELVETFSQQPAFTRPVLCHFRGKLVNSKAKGEVFISPRRTSPLPYFFSASAQTSSPLAPDKHDTQAAKAFISALGFYPDFTDGCKRSATLRS